MELLAEEFFGDFDDGWAAMGAHKRVATPKQEFSQVLSCLFDSEKPFVKRDFVLRFHMRLLTMPH